MRFRIFAGLCLIFFSARISARQEHLYPDPDEAAWMSVKESYDDAGKIRKTLFPPKIEALARVVILPSFDSESVLTLGYDAAQKKYYVIYAKAASKFLFLQTQNKKIPGVKAITTKNELPAASAETVRHLFEKAVAGVKEGKHELYEDGTAYSVICGRHAGTIQEPKYLMSALIGVTDELIGFSRSKAADLSPDLVTAVNKLTKQL